MMETNNCVELAIPHDSPYITDGRYINATEEEPACFEFFLNTGKSIKVPLDKILNCFT